MISVGFGVVALIIFFCGFIIGAAVATQAWC